MIIIEYKGLTASWSSKSEEWSSTDEDFAEVLNRSLPEDDDIAVSTPFKTGGMDKIVLDAAKEVLGKMLKVVAFLPNLAPEEVVGVDY